MSLLAGLRNSISDRTIQNLSANLQEDPAKVKQGFELGISAFMAGVTKFGKSDKDLKSLVNILNDGGHTGDILFNIESFSANNEKIQLLNTIGNNIVNHFLGDKSDGITGRIEELTGLKKENSATLLSISAPLVLGFLGKTIKEKSLGLSGFRSFLDDINTDVAANLPLSVSNILNFPKYAKVQGTNVQKHNEAVLELNNNEKKGKTNWGLVVPWVLLLVAAVALVYFSKFKGSNTQGPKEEILQMADTLHPEDFLPEREEEILLKPMPKSESGLLEETPKEKASTRPMLTESKKEEPLSQPKKSEPVPVVKKEEKPQVKNTESAVKKETVKRTAPDVTPAAVRNNTPVGYTAVERSVFETGSALISHSAGLSGIVSRLKGSNRKITIVPMRGNGARVAEDRAYALKEYLVDNGVELRQIEITESRAGSNASGIAYRISD